MANLNTNTTRNSEDLSKADLEKLKVFAQSQGLFGAYSNIPYKAVLEDIFPLQSSKLKHKRNA